MDQSGQHIKELEQQFKKLHDYLKKIYSFTVEYIPEFGDPEEKEVFYFSVTVEKSDGVTYLRIAFYPDEGNYIEQDYHEGVTFVFEFYQSEIKRWTIEGYFYCIISDESEKKIKDMLDSFDIEMMKPFIDFINSFNVNYKIRVCYIENGEIDDEDYGCEVLLYQIEFDDKKYRHKQMLK